jgi:hypothetical protein
MSFPIVPVIEEVLAPGEFLRVERRNYQNGLNTVAVSSRITDWMWTFARQVGVAGEGSIRK